MTTANLSGTATGFSDGYDGIIIVDNFKSKRGGATLDVTDFPLPSIRAGHVIIKETATGEFKPMPLNGDADEYAALPGGHTYYGILINSILTAKPFAGIMFEGTMNDTIIDPANGVFDISGIKAAVQTAFRAIDNNIKFIGDNQ